MTIDEILRVRGGAQTVACFVPTDEVIVALCDLALRGLEADRYIARNRELEARLATIREVAR